MAGRPPTSSLLSGLCLPSGITLTRAPSSPPHSPEKMRDAFSSTLPLKQEEESILPTLEKEFAFRKLEQHTATLESKRLATKTRKNVSKTSNAKEKAFQCINGHVPIVSHEIDDENNDEEAHLVMDIVEDEDAVETGAEVVKQEAGGVPASCLVVVKKRGRGRGSGRQKPRDPLAPKKHMSGFFCFCQELRKEVQLKVGSRELSRRWKLLDREARQCFQEKADIGKAQYMQAMLTYRSSEGYRQRRLRLRAEKNLMLKNLRAENKMNLMAENEMNMKLKTEMNQNMKADKNLKLMAKMKPRDEAGNVATCPYFSYVASHWDGVAAANPRLDGGQVQKRLWRNWWAREVARIKKKGSAAEKGKQNVKPNEAIEDLDSGDSVEEVMLATVKIKPDVRTATQASRSIIVPTKREVNMVKGYSAGKSRKTETETALEEKTRDSGLKVRLPPGCSIVSAEKVEESPNLPSKEMLVAKEGDNIAPGNAARLLLSPPKSAFECFLASMTPLLPGVRREKREEALAKKWEILTETARGVFEEMAGRPGGTG